MASLQPTLDFQSKAHTWFQLAVCSMVLSSLIPTQPTPYVPSETTDAVVSVFTRICSVEKVVLNCLQQYSVAEQELLLM